MLSENCYVASITSTATCCVGKAVRYTVDGGGDRRPDRTDATALLGMNLIAEADSPFTSSWYYFGFVAGAVILLTVAVSCFLGP